MKALTKFLVILLAASSIAGVAGRSKAATFAAWEVADLAWCDVSMF